MLSTIRYNIVKKLHLNIVWSKKSNIDTWKAIFMIILNNNKNVKPYVNFKHVQFM